MTNSNIDRFTMVAAVAAVLALTHPIWAGDRDHVGGAASPSARSGGVCCNDDGSYNYGPMPTQTPQGTGQPHYPTVMEKLQDAWDQLMRGVVPSELSNTPKGAPGIGQGTRGAACAGCAGGGAGSWGAGGGTGPGARGY
jgi:hypothetical protein